MTHPASYILTFPSGFDLTQVNAPSDCQLPPSSTDTITSCSVNLPLSRIEMSIVVTPGSFAILIQNIVNPNTAGDYELQSAFTYNPNPIQGTATVTIAPFTISSVILTPELQTTNTQCALSVSIDTTVAIDAGDTVKLELAQWYPSTSFHYITVSSPTCSFSISAGAFQPASSCLYDQNSYALQAQLPTGVPAQDTHNLILKVEHFRTPPTTAAVTSFKLSILTPQGMIHEQKTSGLVVQVSSPNTAMPVQVFMNPTTVSTSAAY